MGFSDFLLEDRKQLNEGVILYLLINDYHNTRNNSFYP